MMYRHIGENLSVPSTGLVMYATELKTFPPRAWGRVVWRKHKPPIQPTWWNEFPKLSKSVFDKYISMTLNDLKITWKRGRKNISARDISSLNLINKVQYLDDITQQTHNVDTTLHWIDVVSTLCVRRERIRYSKTPNENMPIRFDPLKPHFYIVKPGFTGVYIIFLISAQKYRLWVLVRTPRRF